MSRSIVTLLSAAICFLMALPAIALPQLNHEHGIITGKVMDELTGEPVRHALVSIIGTSCRSMTGIDGSYTIKDVASGKYMLVASAPGYLEQKRTVEIDSASPKCVDIALRVFVVEDQLVVTATRTERTIRELPVRVELVNRQEIEKSGANNLYEVLDKGIVPGLNVETSCTNCNFSSIRMNGLESGYIALLIDGQPIYSALAGIYLLRQIPPSDIERLEVVKGASSALYGASAIGGVVNIITKEPSEIAPSGLFKASIGEFNESELTGSYSMRQGNFAGIVSATKHQNDFVDDNDDGYTDMVERDNTYFGLKMHYYFLDDKHRVTLFSRIIDEFRKGGYIPGGKPVYDEEGDIIGYTRGIDDALDPDAEHITTRRREYGFSYTGAFADTTEVKMTALTSNHVRDATNGERPFDSDETIYQYDAVLSRDFFSNSTFSLGANYRTELLEQMINWEAQDEMEADVYGLFLQDEINLGGSGVNVVIGGRYDHVDSTLVDDSAFSPRLAVKWDITGNLALRAGFGGGFKVPYLFAEDLHLCSAAPLVDVSPGIKPEKSWSYTLSSTYYGVGYTLDLNLFRTDIKDKIALEYDEELNLGIYDNAGDAFTQGLEVNASLWNIWPCKVDLVVAFVDARYDEQLDPEWEESTYIQRVPHFTAQMTIGYKEKHTGVDLALSGRYIGRQYVEKELVIEGSDELDYSIDHVTDYGLVDLKLTRSFMNDTVELFFGVDNLFDYTQETIYNAEQEDTAAYIYAPLVGRKMYGGLAITF
ncbi:TonB-dependent receptor [bacterium]|nr:TonB-dependent receptor [bacterium]